MRIPGLVNKFTIQNPTKDYDGPTEFNAVLYHFHAGSEHTVEGQRYDLEMHTVHKAVKAKNSIGHAVIGIMFDTKLYNAELSDK